MENLEQEEISLLLGNGYEFQTTFLGKQRTWSIGKIPLGKMLKLSNAFIKMKIDEEALASESLSESIPAQYQAVRDNAKLCIDAVYIAVESELPKWMKWFKIVLKPIIKRHFLNSFDSVELLEFTMELLKSSNYQNFMTSTALMNGNRPTKAKPIESKVSNPSTETLDKSVTISDGL
ncbi:hypothetical protein [Elizabethkingia ursingii]|uniref:hypothetical protein n=1 Tax=Elizabethkingia ursingii TaxID=1756150 RepID=UPI002012C1F5|nr:hypothetical protein [Elizabethkingia ursingii]MCL1671700.1 hypothetical protein [Elizabethkingia ursingii]